jgi:hypothetical protein
VTMNRYRPQRNGGSRPRVPVQRHEGVFLEYELLRVGVLAGKGLRSSSSTTSLATRTSCG